MSRYATISSPNLTFMEHVSILLRRFCGTNPTLELELAAIRAELKRRLETKKESILYPK